MSVLAAVETRARQTPGQCIIDTGEQVIDCQEFYWQVTAVADKLKKLKNPVIGLLADNGLQWIVTDLACRQASITLLPLPTFFSSQQIEHAVLTTDLTHLVTDDHERLLGIPAIGASELPQQDSGLPLLQCEIPKAGSSTMPQDTSKVTFTSGSTGQPKGVCLDNKQQDAVAQALVDAVGLDAPRHLCLLPMSTLLENLAGIYAPLLAGGTIIAPSLAALGFQGSTLASLPKLLSAISQHQPQSIILIPQLLLALVAASSQGWKAPKSLQFIAVGGGKVAPALLQQARSLGLPVFEGYGLSECASVVSLNTRSAQKPGSIGKPLAGREVTIVDGEIIVEGSIFSGYLNDPDSWYPTRVATGDLGFYDDEGFLHINGRRKNLLVSSYGRNISPEWVESELLAGPLLGQCVVFGDDRPYCIALLWPREAATTEQQICDWITRVNHTLPDYAQIRGWQRLDAPLSHQSGQLTSNGRPKRSTIEHDFSIMINQCYTTTTTV